MLRQYGFQTPRTCLATTPDEAARLAAEIGFPVALKVASPDILHKTDIGAVALDLRDAGEVRRAGEGILAAARAAHPTARLDGLEVQEMVRGHHEIIIGLLDDPQFGPVIMFGLGGVLTEILQEVSFRPLPMDRADATQMVHETRAYRVLQGYRGLPAVSEEMLVELLLKAGRMGMDLAGRLESADFNPIAVWGDQHRVLDFKAAWHAGARPALEVRPANTDHLESFFAPASVAVVGASVTTGKIGNAVLDSLLRHEYRGRVYPVNPGRREIMGLEAYPSLSAIPAPVELAVVTVELGLVPGIIEECAARDVHNLIVISGGGKELGGERRELEAEIRRLAHERDVRVIGPNVIGIFDGHSRLDCTFQVHERMLRPRPGRIAVLTQSGTIGAGLLEALADLGVSRFVSYGNRVDVDEADLLAYLAEDPETGLIAMYVEGLEDGRRFLQVAREVAQRKPIVIYKAGRSERGSRASLSHTGYYGGSYQVALGAFRQAGLIAVDSYDELVASCRALAMQPRAQGPHVAMISNGAGTMVQGIDLLQAYGLALPELSPESVARLAAAYPPFYLCQNPVDVTGSATSADYELGIETLMQDPQVDIVMLWFVFQDTPLDEEIVPRLGRLSRAYDKPLLAGAIGGPYTQRISRAIEAEGVPVFHAVRDWMAAARAVARCGREGEAPAEPYARPGRPHA